MWISNIFLYFMLVNACNTIHFYLKVMLGWKYFADLNDKCVIDHEMWNYNFVPLDVPFPGMWEFGFESHFRLFFSSQNPVFRLLMH